MKQSRRKPVLISCDSFRTDLKRKLIRKWRTGVRVFLDAFADEVELCARALKVLPLPLALPLLSPLSLPTCSAFLKLSPKLPSPFLSKLSVALPKLRLLKLPVDRRLSSLRDLQSLCLGTSPTFGTSLQGGENELSGMISL